MKQTGKAVNARPSDILAFRVQVLGFGIQGMGFWACRFGVFGMSHD